MTAIDGSRPTHVRYLVVGVTALMAVLLYLDRFCISFVVPFVGEDLQLSNKQMSVIMGAFFFSYALAQVPSGWLTDRFGARMMLTIYIATWSAFTVLTGMVVASGVIAFVLMLVLRLGFGIAQAGAYPTGASIVSKWVPFSGRGTASSIIAVGGRIGGFLAMFLTGLLIVLFVPTSKSSLLEPADVLDSPRLCQLLANTDASVEGDRKRELRRIDSIVMSGLPGDTQRIVESVAKQAAAHVDQVATKVSSVNLDALTAGLNDVIQQRTIFSREDVMQLPIEKEGEQLAERDRDSLRPDEVERLNRLVLQAAYPESIRKIYGLGWRKLMWTYGAMGLFVAALFWICSRNRPIEHPLCNAAEVALIEGGRPATAPRANGRVRGVPLKRLLKSGSMWLICLSQWCTNVGWVFIMTWAPTYFLKVHQTPVGQLKDFTAIPVFVGWFGMVSGGWLTDRLARMVGLRWGRALPMSLSRFTAMAAYIFCLFNPSPWAAVAAFSVVAFSTDLGTGSVWAFKQDVGGRYVGSILGWGNMWGNLGAAVTPTLLIVIVEESTNWSFYSHLPGLLQADAGGNWNLAFATCAVAFLISGLASLGVNATVPIAPPDDEAEATKP